MITSVTGWSNTGNVIKLPTGRIHIDQGWFGFVSLFYFDEH